MGTNNEHAAVSRWRRAPECLNQRNVLSEPLTAPTLVRGNRRADTRAHTRAPYFNHKLMFCLPRMHNCARCSPRLFVSKPLGHTTNDRDGDTTVTTTTNGWYPWQWHVTSLLMASQTRRVIRACTIIRANATRHSWYSLRSLDFRWILFLFSARGIYSDLILFNRIIIQS